MKNKVLAVAACLALSVPGLAACGGGDADADATNVDTLTVGALPVADYATVYYADQKGLFEEQGLTVEVVPIQGGANSIPALLSGDFSIAVTNYVSYIFALGEGIPVRAVVPAAEGVRNFSAIVAAPGSGIESPADLEGRTIAVNNLRSIAELTARVGLEEAGVDPDSVKFTEVPLPDIPAALDEGKIDAGWVAEPFLSASLAAGATVILDPLSGELDGMPVGAYATSEEFAEANPETLDKFAAAIEQARQELADETTIREFIPSFTGLPPEVAAVVTLPNPARDLDLTDLEELVETMDDYGWLDSEVDVLSSLEYLRDDN